MSARLSSLPRLLAQHTLCDGAHAVECILRESRPARSVFLAKHSRETAAAGRVPGTYGSSSPKLHALRSCGVTRAAKPKRRNMPLARRTCESAVRPRIKSRAFGTASWPRAGQHKNLRCTSSRQRVSWLSAGGAFTRSLGDSKGGGPPNSPQQPTCGRSLARRFRASLLRDAVRRAAACERPHAAEWQSVGQTELPLQRVDTEIAG